MNWIFATIEELQAAMTEGELTAKELTLFYLQRIASYDKEGPKINAIAEINPDALHIAEALDAERSLTGPRGPLHGIPILIKDNIDSGDKMHTTAGSVALENHYATKDSFVAKKLREAGAVILGKANLTEWANFMTEGMPNGYSSRGGQVLNPYGPGKFDVGGSSSGPGAAIASGFAAASVGTETSGSILSPASSNSIVGIKPTVGLISRSGIIPIAHSQDTAGPMAPTVADAAILLGALTETDADDPATFISEGKAQKDYTSNLVLEGLNGARIGVDRNYLTELDEEELQLANEAINVLTRLGAQVIDPVEITTDPSNYSVLYHEFKADLNAYLAKVSGNVPVHNLNELIQFNQQHKEKALKYGQSILIESDEKSGSLTEAEYINARVEDITLSQTEGIDAVMDKHNLDALFFVNYYGCAIAAKAGYPSITVPAGYTSEGKPFGITFTGRAFSEDKLIELAYAYEQATKLRRAPTFH
ncbi:amidase family protein [Aquibacillus kalidii]|uniref:amidase family protein n=1 Tax=Aquibacillus kalidii TaxID=2762597 RepID=UPI001647B825|nr:amidase family protein [Aquibacillus kalidii]